MRPFEEYVGAFEAFEPDGSAVWPRLLKRLSKNPFKQSLARELNIVKSRISKNMDIKITNF